MVKIAADEDKPAYDVVAILDPATRAAQKYTPLLMVSFHRVAKSVQNDDCCQRLTPVSRTTSPQRASDFGEQCEEFDWYLQVLNEVANVNIKLFMNCREKLSEMPLNRWVWPLWFLNMPNKLFASLVCALTRRVPAQFLPVRVGSGGDVRGGRVSGRESDGALPGHGAETSPHARYAVQTRNLNFQ